MWYNRLSEYLLKEGYANNHICPFIFIKKSEAGFAIIVVYVDDLNLVGTLEEFKKTAKYLKKEFEMKDLWNFFFLACKSSISLLECWFTNRHIIKFFLSAFIWIKHTI